MLEGVIELLASGGLSAIVGGVFGFLNRKEDRRQLAQQQEHERHMAEFELNREVTLADKGIERAIADKDVFVESEEAKGFAESLKSKFRFSEIIKSCIRPLILFAYTYQTYLIWLTLSALTGGIAALDPLYLQGLFEIVVLSILHMAIMAASWYFAQRPSKHFNHAMGMLYRDRK